MRRGRGGRRAARCVRLESVGGWFLGVVLSYIICGKIQSSKGSTLHFPFPLPPSLNVKVVNCIYERHHYNPLLPPPLPPPLANLLILSSLHLFSLSLPISAAQSITTQDDSFWERYWADTSLSAYDYFALISSIDIRNLRDTASGNLTALCFKVSLSLPSLSLLSLLSLPISHSHPLFSLCY